MKTQDAIQAFGGKRYLAIALGVSVQAVQKWGEEVPEKRIDQIKGALAQSQPHPPKS